MREDARCWFERHSMSVLGRSAVTGLLVLGIVGIGTGSAASDHWKWWQGWSPKSTTTQSITFTSTPPDPAIVGGTYTPTARGGASGDPVTFSIDPSAKGRCTSSAGRVLFVAGGTCVIDANQAGNARLCSRDPGPTVLRRRRYPEHHLHLDTAQPRARRRDLHPHGDGRGEWQPGHVLDRPVGEGKLQYLGCHRQLRRRRDLRHRRQPGRQRQLCSRDPGPTVLRRRRYPEHHLHLDAAQPRARRRHLHPDGDGRGEWQPGHLLDRPVGEGKLQHLGCDRHLRRRRVLRHRRQPGG